MKVCIRRGAKEIGGSAIELEAEGKRIILDLGLPLDAEESSMDLLPDIKGLRQKTDDLLALLISHPHQDHYALGEFIDRSIPIYMGKIAGQILQAAKSMHLPKAVAFEDTHIIESGKIFEIGPFKITPYLVDHSAYDAYAFLIEAEGKRLFYSGDFRAHGRKAALFEHLVKNPPKNIDALLMEGSSLGRLGSQESFEPESSLEARFTDVFKATKGLSLVQMSSQNFDRIVTVFRACKRTDRTLVISGYTGLMLKVTENPKLPNFTWDGVKKIEAEATKRHHIIAEEMANNPGKYAFILGKGFLPLLENAGLITADASYVYSMWGGYKEKYADVIGKMKVVGVPMTDIHTSGHADVPTLKRLVEALKPKKVVPIHTFYPEEFKTLFENTEIHQDNETFNI